MSGEKIENTAEFKAGGYNLLRLAPPGQEHETVCRAHLMPGGTGEAHNIVHAGAERELSE